MKYGKIWASLRGVVQVGDARQLRGGFHPEDLGVLLWVPLVYMNLERLIGEMGFVLITFKFYHVGVVHLSGGNQVRACII